MPCMGFQKKGQAPIQCFSVTLPIVHECKHHVFCRDIAIEHHDIDKDSVLIDNGVDLNLSEFPAPATKTYFTV